MNTKEAIDFINKHIRQAYYMGVPERMKANDINRLLRRGEKYEAMWGELLKNKGRLGLTDEIRDLPNWDLHVIMKNIEQKYFPKVKKSNDDLLKKQLSKPTMHDEVEDETNEDEMD